MTQLRPSLGLVVWSCLLVASRIAISVDIAPGEILISEMNCAACHDAGAVKDRLASRQAPRLGVEGGVRATSQWLRAFLANPQASKPGSLMPDMLHAFPAVEKTEAVEALTHYLVAMQKPPTTTEEGATSATIAAGKKLYHTLGCMACHAPQELPPNTTDDAKSKAELGKLQAESVPLGDLAHKFSMAELALFLRDPLRTRPSGRMPSLNLGEGEARAVAMYLLRDQVPSGQMAKLHGLAYEYYEAAFPELPEFDRLKPKATGNVDTFSLKVAQRAGDYAIRYRGGIEIKKAGDYTFYANSDDGSRVYVDEKLVADNGGIHAPQEREGNIHLTAGDHTITVTFFQGGGGAELTVAWKGPGFEKKEIPAAILTHEGQAMRPLGDEAFVVDATKAARGRELFAKLNCSACHQLDQPGQNAKSNLAQLAGAKASGCLAANPPANVPKFALTDRQRADLVAQLANQAALAQPLSPADTVKRTMTVLNCFACHQRDLQNGPVGFRREYFTTALTSELATDLGDEGRMPPHLNGVGAKLKPAWIARVLWQGAVVRPYMAARMPQFGEANVKALATALVQADVAAKPATELVVDESMAKLGHKLVGTAGLSCVQCHMFNGHASLGVPALDLATVPERLQADWFRRYLLDPPSLRPGTRMPSFWPDGKAVRKDILEGNTEKQITAIWSYLARGKEANLPDGMIRGKLELVADKEAVIYRHFIAGAGSRAIGVGYPEKLNLAFDANDMRLALLWQGPFMDASKHRTGRGEGYVPPLGYNLIQGTPGAPFAVLETPDSPWPAAVGKTAGYQFRGYTLDEKQRPAFAYSFQDILIEDYPVATNGNPDDFFRRSFTLRVDKPVANLYFRAATAARIEARPDGSYQMDGKLKLKFTGAKPLVRAVGGKSELLIPIPFAGKEARFAEEITW